MKPTLETVIECPTCGELNEVPPTFKDEEYYCSNCWNEVIRFVIIDLGHGETANLPLGDYRKLKPNIFEGE